MLGNTCHNPITNEQFHKRYYPHMREEKEKIRGEIKREMGRDRGRGREGCPGRKEGRGKRGGEI